MTPHQHPAPPTDPAARGAVPRHVTVVGATGKTGRRVVARLTAAGIPVRPVSRSAEVRHDWDDPATWAPPLAGADAVFVAVAPDLAAPGIPEVVADFARVAAQEGVRRFVLLSGRGEPEAQRAERLVADVFPGRTVLRCAWFAQNFSEGFLLDPVLEGVARLPVTGVVEPFVDLEDVAEVAVVALTGPGHEGRVYELTGPRLLTFGDALAEIGAAAGGDVRLQTVTGDEFAVGLTAEGLPADVVELMRYLFEEILDGRNAHLAPGVREALSRQPRDFAEFVRREADAWATPSAPPAAPAGMLPGSR